MYNNFLSIENPNPLMPNMPFMMPPMGIAPWMMPGMPGLVPMMAPMMNPGQAPTNYQDYTSHNNATYSQAYHPTLGQVHANPYYPPGIPVPTSSTSNKTVSRSVFHSLVVIKLLKYIEEKKNKDSVEVEAIDLVSDEEEEEEINVLDSPIVENSMMGVISSQDSGRYSGESDAPQTDGEKAEEESMEDEFIVVNSSKSPVVSFENSLEEPSILDSNPPLISEAPTVQQLKISVGKPKSRKYSKFFFLFTTAQIEFLEFLFSKNGTITPKQVKYFADGNELVEEQIKKWLKHRRNMRFKANVRERKRMENISKICGEDN